MNPIKTCLFSRVYLLIILFCISPIAVTAGNGPILTGSVINSETGTPISGAIVTVEGREQVEFTDLTGAFKLSNLDAGEVALTVSCLGYKPIWKKINLESTSSIALVFKLEPEIIRFDDVTVTAFRYPGSTFDQPKSISVVTADKRDTRNVTSTADALGEESGIMIQKTTQGHGSPIMRGLMGDYILLLYNNIRLNKSTLRYGPNQYLNTVDGETIDRIEVIKGPLSVLYGSDAMGGVINMLAHNSVEEPPITAVHSKLTAQYSSVNDGRSIHANMDAIGKRGNLKIGAGGKSIHDLKGGGSIGRQSPTGWNQSSFDASLDYHIRPDKSINIDYLTVRQNSVPRYDKYSDGSHRQYLYDPQDRTLVAATFASQSMETGIPSFTINASYQSETEGQIKQKTGDTRITRDLDKVATWGGFAQAVSYITPIHRLVYGLEAYHDRISSSRKDYDGTSIVEKRPSFPDNSRYYSFGVFLEDRWQASRKFMITAGIRYSRFGIDANLEPPFSELKETFGNFTAALSCQLIPDNHWQVYFDLARGFRAPNLDDAAVLQETNQGMDSPNPDIGSEYSTYLEIGAKFKNDVMYTSASVFANMMHDLIDRRPGSYLGKTYFDANENDVQDDGELDIYIKQNVGEASIYGAEYNLAWECYRFLTIRSNGQWTWGKNQSDNEPLSRIPPIMGHLGVRMKITNDFWAESFLRAAGAQRRVSPRDISDNRIGLSGTDGWVTINLRFEYQTGHIKGNLLLENLTDAAYKTHGSGVYSPGRNVMIKMTFFGP